MYKCDICDKELLSKYSLNVHRAKHDIKSEKVDDDEDDSDNGKHKIKLINICSTLK